MAAFAEVSDLEARWRPLAPDERLRAAVLLEDASVLLRAESPTIDARLASEPPTLDAGIPRMIVCKMVQRAMQSGADAAAVSALQQTAGPFSQSVTYSNPSGELYLTKSERKMLGVGTQRAFSIDLAPNAGAAISSPLDGWS